MFIKVFLAAVVVLEILGCIGENEEAYWNMVEEKQQLEKENAVNE